MTDPTRPDPAARPPAPGPAVADATGAGALLRAARQQQGIHIAALAASMKVPPARLEALEAGRYHELVDTTFTRALAQAMCRALRIDPAPVLAQLPGSSPDALGRVDGGLNTPFREHGTRGLPSDWAPWRRPVLWLVGLLLLAAAGFVLVPAGALRDAGVPINAATPVLPPSRRRRWSPTESRSSQRSTRSARRTSPTSRRRWTRTSSSAATRSVTRRRSRA